MFGSDFDVSRPEDSGAVKHGASWIRDIKARLKRFLAVMFNLETGKMKNDVIGSEMLKDLVTPGTYTEVTVNRKGLVTSGSNPVEQKSAQVFRAIFTTSNVIYETEAGLSDPAAGAAGTFTAGSGTPYKVDYPTLDQCQYVSYSFQIPTGVRRIKALIVGGGGGKDTTGSFYGGAGGELVETVFDVVGVSSLGVIVGDGGGNGSPAGHGGPSSVFSSASVYAEAGGGEGGGAGAAGSPVAGSASTSVLNVIRVPGQAGSAGVGGDTGSYWKTYGYGSPKEAADGAGNPGVVILEWVL